MYFVDVILPVPLEGLFTYGLPEQWAAQVTMGVRVLVPLGKSKHYIAMAVRVHQTEPQVKWKNIEQVHDDKPVLRQEQMRLWQWISDYYMSPIGDVFKAAMPSGMKTEEGYRPRTETCLDLAEKWRSEQNLHLALDMMRRAEKQRKVFETFLTMTGWDQIEGSVPQGQIRPTYRHIVKAGLNVRESEEYIADLTAGKIKPKPKKKKHTTRGFTRNMQIAVNSVNQCVQMIEKMGVKAVLEMDDSDDELRMIIRLPK